MRNISILFILFVPCFIQAQTECSTPIEASISLGGPACPGQTITVTFNLEDDDDDDDDDDDEFFDVIFQVNGMQETLSGIEDGHTLEIIAEIGTITLISVYDLEADCFTTLNQSLPIPVFPQPTLALTISNPTCGQNNGNILAIAGNGTSPYSFSINGSSSQSNGFFDNLTPGTYEVSLTDANGCGTAQTAILQENPPPSAILDNILFPSCGLANGQFLIVVSGGTAPYTYSVNGSSPQNNGLFSSLGSGSYTAFVTDATGCTATANITFDPSTNPTLALTIVQQPSCGLSNGTINAQASGGNPPFSFQLNGGNPQSSGTFSNLGSGSYQVIVTDANGCTDDQSIALQALAAPTLTISVVQQPACGQNNGTINAQASGGNPPFSFQLNGGNPQASGTFSNLGSGSYQVIVTDANGCTDAQSIALQALAAPTLTLAVVQQPACGQTNGTINAQASGGNPPFSFQLNGGNPQSSGTFSNLGSGSYQVIVTDANGCTDDQSIALQALAAPTLALTVVQQPACGQNNGTINAQASGGNPPFSFQLNGGNPQASGTFSNLGTGSYQVIVTDANGCTDAQSIALQALAAPSLTLTVVQQPACGQNNGTINAQASGGNQPFSFQLNGGNPQSSGTFSNLGSGSYQVIVTDANGCTDAQSIVLQALAAPTLTLSVVQQPACGQSNGTINAQASGGLPPFSFQLNGGNPQSSGTFSNLGSGSYQVIVTDANGCTDDQSIVLQALAAPTLTLSVVQQPTCGQNNGTINAQASGGNQPFSFQLNGGNPQPSGTFSNLGSGSYQIIVTDGQGCSNAQNIQLADVSNSLPLAAITLADPTPCFNSPVIIIGNLPNGTSGFWQGPGISFSQPSNPQQTLTGLLPGTYLVTWTLSAPGCPNYSSQSKVFTVIPPPNASDDSFSQNNPGDQVSLPFLDNDTFVQPVAIRIIQKPSQGSIVQSGTESFEYFPNANAVGEDSILYEICYTESCPDLCDSAWVVIDLMENNPCIITQDTSNAFSNGLTPNGDGKNDVLFFQLVSVEDCFVNYAQSELIVYNRWGDRVFQASPYKNDWGGETQNGGILPPGVYYFALRITLQRQFTVFGSVIIFR